jgi:DNA-binding beta-propeller fold protein YncE
VAHVKSKKRQNASTIVLQPARRLAGPLMGRSKMKRHMSLVLGALATAVLMGAPAHGEILAMTNYETKSEDSLKTLKLTGPRVREEGIAIIDVDPDSEALGDILMTIPLPPDLVAHHIFFNRDMTKAYVTALGRNILHVIDMSTFPYRLKPIEVSECKSGEDVVFSADNKTWYLTCMDSAKVFVGDSATDTVKTVIPLPVPYPHGIAINSEIDRILVTSTVRGSDLGDPGETITVIDAATNKVLSSHKVSNKPSPSGEAPVEVLFVPGSNPPVAYINNMFGGTLWTATWDPAKKAFDFAQAFDFGAIGSGVPLELYVNPAADRLYVTTAKPGHFHIFDIGEDPAKPKLLKSLAAAEGAHHVAFTKDYRYAFVQNALLNLPGMSDGSITVVDLQKQEVIASVDTLKDRGYNPNSIVLLPEWNHLAGH